jgi:hypothetical protein
MTLPATIELEVDISWDGSGDFDGDYDAVIGDAASEPGVTLTHGRQDSLTLSPPRVSDGGVELHNDDGIYSQERADSPIYQRVLPGRPVRYQARYGVSRTYREPDTLYRANLPYRGLGVYPLGRHIIRDISQVTDLGARRVKLETIGYETVLTKAVVTVALQSNIRTDQAFTLLLDAAGWPADARDISVGDTTLLYWWCDERHPWDAMLELLAAEGPGTFYVDREGVFHFENRNYRTIETRSMTSQATFFDVVAGIRLMYREADMLYRTNRLYRGRTSGLWFTRLDYDPAFQNIRNRATYPTKRRAEAPSAIKVWEYGAAITLAASQSITLFARPQNPFIDALSPVLSTDYAVSGGTVSVSLTYSSGLVGIIVITALTGTPTVDSVVPGTGIQLRAKPLTVLAETVAQNSVDASASINKYSPVPGANIPLPLTLSGWPEVTVATAEAVCNAWVLRYMDQRPLVSITLRNADSAHVRQQLERLPSDRITVTEQNSGLNADMWINAVQLRVAGAGGRVIEVVLSGELCNELTGAIWNESEWDDVTSEWGV